jgi:protein-disulfide isomerase
LFFLLSLALLIAVIAVAANSGSSAVKQQLVTPRAPNAAQRTYALLLGLPQRGSVLGYRKAPVTLQFFGDLQCKQSRQVMLGALPFLIRRWVRAGKLQIRFRSTETDTKRAGGWFEFREQQSAALAAGRQDKLWNFIDVFYREQGPEFTGYVDEPFLHRIAIKAGVNLERWEDDRASEMWVDQLEADGHLGRKKRIRSTPSFLIGPTGGPARVLRHFALEEPGVFEEAIRGLV